MVRRQAGNQPQHRRLSTTRWTEDRDELSLVPQVGHGKGHVLDDRQAAEALGDADEVDDVGQSGGGDRLSHDQFSTTRYGNRPR